MILINTAMLYHTSEQALFRMVCEAENMPFDSMWLDYRRECRTPSIVKYYCLAMIVGYGTIQHHSRRR